MPDGTEIEAGAKAISEFIVIGKELAKVPLLPKYQECAKDLYLISKRIMDANKNVAFWLNEFLKFDFHKPTARTDFLTLVAKYNTMKSGKERQQLKFNCGDIQNIYQRNLENKILQWFKKDQSKLINAQEIFDRLTQSDAQMVQFVEESIIKRIDGIALEIENEINKDDLQKAEKIRINSDKNMRKISELVELFNSELTDLVNEFAKVSKTPISLDD